MEKVLFLNTYKDPQANGANRSYWAKFFKGLITQDKYKMKLHSSFDEDMPIYEYYSETKCRFVRVMQYDPRSELVDIEKYTTDRFLTAWIDERVYLGQDPSEDIQTRPELVICLLMTKNNIAITKKLIHSWFFEKEQETNDLIKKIYEEQDRIDERLGLKWMENTNETD